VNFSVPLPAQASFRASVMLGYQWEETVAESGQTIPVFGEIHVISEGGRVLLNEPFILPSTVVVSDPSGAVEYVRNLDYTQYETGIETEIEILPGGRIVVGDTIRVDYAYEVQASSNRNGVLADFGGDLSLRGLSIFFRRTLLDAGEPADVTESPTYGSYYHTVLGAQYSMPLARGAGQLRFRAEQRWDQTGLLKSRSSLVSGSLIYAISRTLNGELTGQYSANRGQFRSFDRNTVFGVLTWNVARAWTVFGQAGHWYWSQVPGGTTNQLRFAVGLSYTLGATIIEARTDFANNEYSASSSDLAERRFVVRVVRSF
jgi:hypothetical protein